MFFIIFTSLSTLLCSILILFTYRLIVRPRQIVKGLISQGAVLMKLQKNQVDDFSNFKQAIQKAPNTKVMVEPFPGMTSFYFIDTTLIKEILTNHKNYSKLGKTSELGNLFHSKGILLSEDDKWKLHRKIISGAFQYTLFNEMISPILDITEEVLSPNFQQRTIKVPDTIEQITADAITRIFFGLRSCDVIINGKTATEEATEIVQKMSMYNTNPIRFAFGAKALNVFSDYRRTKDRIKNFRAIFLQKIQERMGSLKKDLGKNQEKDRKDLLQVLLQHQIDHKNDPTETLTDEEILDEFAVFFIAGKDTTSLLLSLSLYCCVKHPQWIQILRKEVQENLQDMKKEDVNLEQLNKMDQMSAFLNEVLRMFPPGPGILPRAAKKDHFIGDYFVRKGDLVNTLFICNHFNPNFFDEPEKFDPSRWLQIKDSQEGWKNDSFSYLPFSAGGRNCIGKHLALMEAKIILSYILKNFDLDIDQNFKLRMGLHVVGYGPTEPIPVGLTPVKTNN